MRAAFSSPACGGSALASRTAAQLGDGGRRPEVGGAIVLIDGLSAPPSTRRHALARFPQREKECPT